MESDIVNNEDIDQIIENCKDVYICILTLNAFLNNNSFHTLYYRIFWYQNGFNDDSNRLEITDSNGNPDYLEDGSYLQYSISYYSLDDSLKVVNYDIGIFFPIEHNASGFIDILQLRNAETTESFYNKYEETTINQEDGYLFKIPITLDGFTYSPPFHTENFSLELYTAPSVPTPP